MTISRRLGRVQKGARLVGNTDMAGRVLNVILTFVHLFIEIVQGPIYWIIEGAAREYCENSPTHTFQRPLRNTHGPPGNGYRQF